MDTNDVELRLAHTEHRADAMHDQITDLKVMAATNEARWTVTMPTLVTKADLFEAVNAINKSNSDSHQIVQQQISKIHYWILALAIAQYAALAGIMLVLKS